MYRIQAAAFEQLIEMRHQTKLGLRYALSKRKHIVCELDVRPVQVMLPYEGAANRKYLTHITEFLRFFIPPYVV